MLKHHTKLEKNSIFMLLGIVIVVLIGGIVEIIPLFRMETVIEPVTGVRPYTPLEMAGFNVYRREGCYLCHSQQIRPLRDEVARYGHYSLAAESMYDRPFQWGSKRTGPDLARVGSKYSDAWHVKHLNEPRNVVPESIMPSYSFLAKYETDLKRVQSEMGIMKLLGVPYTDEMIADAVKDGAAQASNDTDADAFAKKYPKANVRDFDGNPAVTSDMDALIAYLQVLGTMVDFKNNDVASRPGEAK